MLSARAEGTKRLMFWPRAVNKAADETELAELAERVLATATAVAADQRARRDDLQPRPSWASPGGVADHNILMMSLEHLAQLRAALGLRETDPNPSMGLTTAILAMNLCSSVTLYGFNRSSTLYHYWDARASALTTQLDIN